MDVRACAVSSRMFDEEGKNILMGARSDNNGDEIALVREKLKKICRYSEGRLTQRSPRGANSYKQLQQQRCG